MTAPGDRLPAGPLGRRTVAANRSMPAFKFVSGMVSYLRARVRGVGVWRPTGSPGGERSQPALVLT